MHKITALSPAKINLTLDVKPKTPGADYHALETLYHLVNWGDEMTIEPRQQFELVGDFDCKLEDNLIYKTWELMQKIPLNPPFRKEERSPFSKGRTEEGFCPVRVTVQKQIPTGGGLGGGSSNVATFIKLYYQLFELGPIPTELIAELGDLGKDIPFFFCPQPCALGTHFGDVIEPVNFNFSGTKIYLYFPGFSSPTEAAYAQLQNFDTAFTQKFLAEPRLENCRNTFASLFKENIQHSTFNTKHLYLSGSGSTWFSFDLLDVPGWEVVETELL